MPKSKKKRIRAARDDKNEESSDEEVQKKSKAVNDFNLFSNYLSTFYKLQY